MTSHLLSLAELTERGALDLLHYEQRDHPPESALEWLGIAVAQIPKLAASAGTADSVPVKTRAAIRRPLLDALARDLGVAAATVQHARDRVIERHPGCDVGDAGAEGYAEILEVSHRSAHRRAEMMIGSYASFLGAAIEAAGGLSDAELGIARGRRWDRADHERTAEVRAGQLYAALTNTLGGLLAHARLLAEDAAKL